MKFKLNVVTDLFLLFQFLHARNIDVDRNDVYATATPPNRVNGDATHEGQYPFSVMFYENKPRIISVGVFLSPICTGSIISARWIITTAIPLGNYPINTYFLLAGLRIIPNHPDKVTNFTDNIYRIGIMVVHPKWHEYDINNLGLARTTEPFMFGKELGTIRMPSKFNLKIAEGFDDMVCTVNIWATSNLRREHLLGFYQVDPISKQTIYLNIKKDPQLSCPDVVFTNNTLCLMQFAPANPHDVCRVNLGAIVQCDCQAVGIFTGVKGNLDCVNVPPLRYTAVNLPQYLKWITKVTETPDPHNHQIHEISSASFMCLSFILTFPYLTVIFKGVF